MVNLYSFKARVYLKIGLQKVTVFWNTVLCSESLRRLFNGADVSKRSQCLHLRVIQVRGGSNMTGTDSCVNKPHCAAAVRP